MRPFPQFSVSIRDRVLITSFSVLFVAILVMYIFVDVSTSRREDQFLEASLSQHRESLTELAKDSNVTMESFVHHMHSGGVHGILELPNGTRIGEEVPLSIVAQTQTFTLEQVGGYHLVTVTLWLDRTEYARSHQILRSSLATVGIAALGVSLALTVALTNISLRPLDSMARTVKRIAVGERGLRLVNQTGATELRRTITLINSMLDNVELTERKLREAEAAAKRSTEQMKSLLSDAAHELKTPVFGIQITAEQLLRIGDENQEDKEKLEFILVQEASRINTLVQKLLELTRAESGVELEIIPIEIREVMEREFARHKLSTPEFTFVYQGGEPTIHSDLNACVSVFSNIITNGRYAAGLEGFLAVKVQVRDVDGVAWVRVDLANNGPEIPEADRDRIFQRLVRLKGDTTRPGMGLGLPIALGYVEALGGKLWHVPGAGQTDPVFDRDGSPVTMNACFVVELPMRQQEIAST